MGEFEKHVTADYLRKAWEALREVNELSYKLAGLPGSKTVLDVGCGPGLDAVAMAKLAIDGHVTGIDISSDMLVEARKLAASESVASNTTFVEGSADKLPFADASFEAVRAERLFQVLPKDIFPPERIFSEMLRVLKPGGHLVLIDMDWGSASIDFPDLDMERKFVGIFARHTRPNGYSGRYFKRWMVESGLRDVETHAFARVMEHLEDCPLGAWLAEDAAKRGFATAEESRNWIETLTEKNAKGLFLATGTMMVVAGRKPDGRGA
jgi:ubiquinone/menaquinone biosynthesis C-methylase UbiE